MTLDQIISSQINRSTQFAAQQGFGTALILGYHTLYGDRIRYYSSEQAAVDDGFTQAAYPALYKQINKLFSQDPRPTRVAIGRMGAAPAKTLQISPKITTQGTIYVFDVVDSAGVAHTITYTVGAAETVATIVTALTALVTALTLVNATDATTHVTIVPSVASASLRLANLPSSATLEVLDVTADAGVVADLDAISLVDASGWYFLLLASNDKASILAAAPWIQARKKLFFYNTSDSENRATGVTTGIGYVLRAAGYTRSYGTFQGRGTDTGHAAALVGRKSVVDLDTSTTSWEYADLAGIEVDRLTDNDQIVLAANGLGWYVEEGGSGAQLNSLMGGLEWIDIMHGLDWLSRRLQEDTYSTIRAANNSGRKIPMSGKGLKVIENVVLGRLLVAVRTGFLDGERPPSVLPKTIDQIAPADRAARLYRQVDWNAYVAGAIHKVNIVGTLSV